MQREDRVEIPPELVQWAQSTEAKELVSNLCAKAGARSIVFSVIRPGSVAFIVHGDNVDIMRRTRMLLEANLTGQREYLYRKEATERMENDLRATTEEFESGQRVEFSIPENLIGLVIGKAGANVNKVKELTGVDKIVVDTKTRVVRIRGMDAVQVEKARSMLEYEEVEVPIEPHHVRTILGERGRNLNELSKNSGCISATLDRLPEDNAILRLVGTKQSVEMAQCLIDTQLDYERKISGLMHEEKQMKKKLEKIDMEFRDNTTPQYAIPRRRSNIDDMPVEENIKKDMKRLSLAEKAPENPPTVPKKQNNTVSNGTEKKDKSKSAKTQSSTSDKAPEKKTSETEGKPKTKTKQPSTGTVSESAKQKGKGATTTEPKSSATAAPATKTKKEKAPAPEKAPQPSEAKPKTKAGAATTSKVQSDDAATKPKTKPSSKQPSTEKTETKAPNSKSTKAKASTATKAPAAASEATAPKAKPKSNTESKVPPATTSENPSTKSAEVAIEKPKVKAKVQTNNPPRPVAKPAAAEAAPAAVAAPSDNTKAKKTAGTTTGPKPSAASNTTPKKDVAAPPEAPKKESVSTTPKAGTKPEATPSPAAGNRRKRAAKKKSEPQQ